MIKSLFFILLLIFTGCNNKISNEEKIPDNEKFFGIALGHTFDTTSFEKSENPDGSGTYSRNLLDNQNLKRLIIQTDKDKKVISILAVNDQYSQYDNPYSDGNAVFQMITQKYGTPICKEESISMMGKVAEECSLYYKDKYKITLKALSLLNRNSLSLMIKYGAKSKDDI